MRITVWFGSGPNGGNRRYKGGREAKLLDIESRLKLAALMLEARVALPAVREPILTAPTLRRKKPDCFRRRKDDCVDRE